jgi:two-component system chemotaxis sensor kinase CheA
VTIDIQLDGFLDDYFAECDEHLADARRHLLALEASVDSPATQRQPVDDLFRIFHSIKGISGMVELREAEELAHEMESYLRALRQRERELTAEGVDALIDATQRLERVVAARSRSESIPTIADIQVRLATLVAPGTIAGGAPSGEARSHGQAKGRTPTHRVLFKPSRELADQGIRVDAVRRRIGEHATIVETAPVVGADGTIEFVFLVATDTPDALAGLGELRATVEPLGQPDAPEPGVAPPVVPADTALVDRATTSHYVRVDLDRLDELMRQVGDLVISRARMSESLAAAEARIPQGPWRAIQENAATIDRQLRALREGIMRVRLVPIGEIFGRMPLVVRDLARSYGRRVDVQVTGQGTEIDKYLIERMMDPVLHLVRNAVAHGIETPAEREAAGKPPNGTIRLSAGTAGDMVAIVVEDDGRGVDQEQVVRRAKAAGIPLPGGPLTDAALLNVLCAPGFSTRDESDRAAGRGVGMSVVRNAVQQLAGTLSLTSTPGRGTRFSMQLPLTLAITDALITRVGQQLFAVPQGSVREVLEVNTEVIKRIDQREVMPHRAAALPLLRLGHLFDIPAAPLHRLHVFVCGHDRNTVGFVVDRIVGQREIVVRPILDPLVRVDGVSGATDLGDGRVVLILDPAALARMAGGPAAAGIDGPVAVRAQERVVAL